MARSRPGALFESGLREVAKQMGSEGAEPGDLSKVRMVPYLTNRLMPKHPKLDTRCARELRTHCEALDSLMEGKPAQCADLLMQRTKALETSLSAGWRQATYQEVVREDEGLTTLEERLEVTKQELQQARLGGGGRRSQSGNRGGDAG